ncbi:hypothetical protein C8J56DRAFT_487050 [Mycena floridula]|nr:hypothetical protein C8J56DRAFT_487050 [Mycena floridula]
MSSKRALSYKKPVLSEQGSQQVRRERYLELQKSRRANHIESSRNLDLFSSLTLGDSHGSDDEEEIVREGVASFASMLGPSDSTVPRKTKPHQKWADKCMYAELLEMSDSDLWNDGLPDDLDSGWIGVAPVPRGKRCLAICHHASTGVQGQVPNTMIRSRVLGKPLMAKFPSSLPPDTILDCILDQNWRDTGILHVLDVLKWKGQDIADCETPFRFWWRDTRIGELSQLPTQRAKSQHPFSFPTLLLPIPYHVTSLSTLCSQIIPIARSSRIITVTIPPGPGNIGDTLAMDTTLDEVSQPMNVTVSPDGLLLYVATASYEAGTSPLSSWIPMISHDATVVESPLEKFQRLVQRRIEKNSHDKASMDVE